jgi:hypothetical protein
MVMNTETCSKNVAPFKAVETYRDSYCEFLNLKYIIRKHREIEDLFSEFKF